jgi:heptosyltransferase-3
MIATSEQQEQLISRPAPDADLLVVIVARIGDTLLVTPMLRALKAACPRGDLTVLAHRKRLAVLEHLPFIDTLRSISPRTARFRGLLAKRRYDCAFVYGHDAALVKYALRVARRVIAYASPGKHSREARGSERLGRVHVPQAPMHAVHERLLLAEAAGIGSTDSRLAYVVTDREKAWAVDWIATNLQAPEQPLIGLQVMSFRTKAHRNWPCAYFADLVNLILTARPSAHFVVLGDSEARDAANELMLRCPARVQIAAGDLTLRQSAAIIAELDLYIGVDTGPTHIAGALDVPMIGLYHRNYPGSNLAPLSRERCAVLEQPADGEISVERVFAEVERLLPLSQ